MTDPLTDLNRYVESKVSCCVDTDTPDDPHGPVVDTHFLRIAVDETVDPAEFRRLIEAAYGHGAFGDGPLTADLLRGGPSYITLGYALGDQTRALWFMAVGAAAHLWEVVTPKRLHVEGSMADQMAGAGYVMITGLRDEATPNHAIRATPSGPDGPSEVSAP